MKKILLNSWRKKRTTLSNARALPSFSQRKTIKRICKRNFIFNNFNLPKNYILSIPTTYVTMTINVNTPINILSSLGLHTIINIPSPHIMIRADDDIDLL